MAFDLYKLFYLKVLNTWHNVIGAHGKRNLMKLSPLKVEPNLILEPRNPTPKPP